MVGRHCATMLPRFLTHAGDQLPFKVRIKQLSKLDVIVPLGAAAPRQCARKRVTADNLGEVKGMME
mgnify:CR=1 FL=1